MTLEERIASGAPSTRPSLALRQRVWLALTILVLAGLPLVLGEGRIFLTVDFLVLVLFAMSYNLLLGLGGMLSFGHAAYYGLGAYAVAIGTQKLGLPLWLAFATAPFVSGLAALVVGWLCVRLSGMYFAMLTLAFGQLIYSVVLGWYSVTGGDDGLPVEVPAWLLPATNYYYVCLVVVLACIWLIWRITRSPLGLALGAIRENRQRAIYTGLNVRALELKVFVIAGGFAGVAGALRAPVQQSAFPSMLYWTQSAEPVLVTLAGGIGTFLGPVVGSAFFVFANFVITANVEYPLLVFGCLVLVIVILLPGGIVGFIQERLAARTARRSGS